MEKTTITKSAKETQELGTAIARDVKPGTILCLHGELGAGKTTFVQGLAKGLGIKQRIISPTFVMIRQYTFHFYHIDLYRVESQADLKGLGIEEILSDPENIVAIEWAEKLGELLPKERVDVMFEDISEEERRIEIRSLGH